MNFEKSCFLILDKACFTYSAFKVRRNTCGDGEPINVIGDVLVENVSKPLPWHQPGLLPRCQQFDSLNGGNWIGKLLRLQSQINEMGDFIQGVSLDSMKGPLHYLNS